MRLIKKLVSLTAVAFMIIPGITAHAYDGVTTLSASAEIIGASSGTITVSNPIDAIMTDSGKFLDEIQQEEAKRAEEARKAAEAAEAKRKAEENRVVMPLGGNVTVTSPYGVARSMVLQNGSYYSDVHNGIDFVNGDSNADIVAYRKGTVAYAGVDAAGGYSVVLNHGDHYSLYYHLKPGSITVEVGQQVLPGQKLGTIGTSGISTGIHLHFGISTGLHSGYVDPMSGWLPPL